MNVLTADDADSTILPTVEELYVIRQFNCCTQYHKYFRSHYYTELLIVSNAYLTVQKQIYVFKKHTTYFTQTIFQLVGCHKYFS